MANTDTTLKPAGRIPQLHIGHLLGLLLLLAPLSYIVGRLSATYITNTYVHFLANGAAAVALGIMIGLPIGIFFGTLRPPAAPIHALPSPNTLEMERSILEQLKTELSEDVALFEARKGSTTMYARIDYIMSFWNTVKASGRLFVMQDAALLGVIASAYYWLEQASRLELLAYDAKYAADNEGGPAQAQRLIAEVRLLDGQLETSLGAAVAAIDNALKA